MQTFLLDWCDELLQRNESVYTFLLGTVPLPEYSVEALQKICARKLGNVEAASLVIDCAVANRKCEALWEKLAQTQPTNSCLAPYPGLSEKIAEYAGFSKSKAIRRRIEEFRLSIAMLSSWEDFQPFLDGDLSDDSNSDY